MTKQQRLSILTEIWSTVYLTISLLHVPTLHKNPLQSTVLDAVVYQDCQP